MFSRSQESLRLYKVVYLLFEMGLKREGRKEGRRVRMTWWPKMKGKGGGNPRLSTVHTDFCACIFGQLAQVFGQDTGGLGLKLFGEIFLSRFAT